MPEVVSDIIVTAAKVYVAPVGTTLPADTLAAGGTWPVGWVSAGFTLESTKATYTFDTLDIFVQQLMGAVGRIRTKEELTLETMLAEHSAGSLALALAGSVSTTAASSGQPGKEEFYIGDDFNLPIKMWGIEGSYYDEDGVQFPIRAYIWRATTAEGGTIEWDKEKVAGIPLQVKALSDVTKPVGQRLMKVVRILEPAS